MAHKEHGEMKVHKLKRCQYKRTRSIELKNKWLLNRVLDMGKKSNWSVWMLADHNKD